ncbi:MAG: TonB-dependent receptor [Bacteroidota bacterium]
MRPCLFSKILSICIIMLMALGIQAQTTVSGKVTDEKGEGLIGAAVSIVGTSSGVSTDIDGNFELSTSRDVPFEIEISYTGFTSQTIEISESTSGLTIALVEGILIGEEVVVSASRKREKVQEAPASVTVLSSRKLEQSPQTDPVRNLVNVAGVQIQQQSANRINIEMRASSGLFSTSVFPILDYRSLVGPGIGTFQTDASGLSNIDLDRIEVVRGPGSALYGPGVTSGVIHFISKNPIDHQGTTIQVGGGELGTYLLAARYAHANKAKTFGFKINAQYNRGGEFTLDGTEGVSDAAGTFTSRIDAFADQIVQPAVTNGIVDLTLPGEVLLTLDELDPDGDGNVMQDYWFNTSVNTTLEFRPSGDLSFFLSGGYNQASTVFYNDLGEGLAQSQEYWTQLRAQWKGLFVQAFFVDNNGGSKEKPTLLYTTGNRSPVGRKQIEAQVQYNVEFPSVLGADLTFGVDYRRAINETFNLVYGRNENDDAYRIFGGYAQAKFALVDQLDLLLAGRYDDFNFLDEGFFSPRVALVFKPDPKHTIRASFNRAGAPPTGLEYNIDFPVNAPIPGVFDFWLAGQNEIHEFPDPTEAMIEFLNQNVIAQLAGLDPTDPSIAPILAALPDELPYQTPGLPTNLGYQLLNPQVTPLVVAGLEADPMTAALAGPIGDFLASYAPGGTTGTFFGVNAFDQNAPLNQLIPTNQPTVVSSNTIEVGYKGLIANKLSLMVDIYNTSRKGFSDFTQIAPLISLIGADLVTDLTTEMTDDLTAFLMSIGVPDPNASALAAGIADSYGGAAVVSGLDLLVPALYGTGTVESSRVPQGDGITHVAAGYRIFPDAKTDYWGIDFGAEFFFTDDLSLWANYSWVSETQFDAEELGEPADSPLAFSLNVPSNKFRVGLNYLPATGFRGNISLQHDNGFFSNTGIYGGDIPSKTVVDAAVGYAFKGKLDGLTLDLSATNVLDTPYRAFNNMPEIRRRIIAKATYTFGNK